jgi:hypothetical protein
MSGDVLPLRQERPKRRHRVEQWRAVPLTRALFDLGRALERDPLTAAMVQGEAYAHAALAEGLSLALLRGGYFIGCAGLMPRWTGRAVAWSLISGFATTRDFAVGVRLFRRFMDMKQRDPMFRRIEIHVGASIPGGANFAQALGFVFEGRCIAYAPDGRDFDLYARVRR